jgi:hypothetical protein
MWRPANLVAAANWQNEFEFSNENNDRTNHCGQQSKQRHQDGSQGPDWSESCGDFEAVLNVERLFDGTLRSPRGTARQLGEQTGKSEPRRQRNRPARPDPQPQKSLSAPYLPPPSILPPGRVGQARI